MWPYVSMPQWLGWWFQFTYNANSNDEGIVDEYVRDSDDDEGTDSDDAWNDDENGTKKKLWKRRYR